MYKFLLVFLLVLSSPSFADPSDPSGEGAVPSMEKRIHQRINTTRREHGLPPLALKPPLTEVARTHSRRMSREGFFSHTDPEGRQVDVRLKGAGLSFRMAGENIFRSENVPDPVDAAVRGWMRSPGHRANILHEGFTETGIGVWRKGATFTITQIFRRPFGSVSQ